MENKNICKFFLKNNCTHGDKCKFLHDKDVCKNFFEGVCKWDDKCKFKHIKNKSKNTVDFTPNYEKSAMNILVSTSKKIYNSNDLIIVPDFLNDTDIYNKLLKEIDNSGIDKNQLWKLWHGDNHLIADDNLNWKDKVPTFQYIINHIEKYFNMEVKSTRFNYYKDSNDWKPFHHDAAAIKENIAKNQNFTVGVSFGAIRDIAFQHSKTKTVISIPLFDSYAYAFSKDINIDWKHGIPQINPENGFSEGRISIIAWGKVDIC
jgi:hypothetical protein